MEKICDVFVCDSIRRSLKFVRCDNRIYLPKERILILFFSRYSHYRVFNFNNKKVLDVSSTTSSEPFFLSEDVLTAIINDTFDFNFGYKNIEYTFGDFTDKNMMEPIETEEIKDFSAYKDKKLGSLNMIKILRAKNVKAIRRMLLTDDYAYDNDTKFGEGDELDKFDLINELKKGGTKGYNFRYENEKDISGSCYSFDFFNVVVK